MVKSGDYEVLSINRDITDRKHAEREVVLQRDFLTTVVNTAKSIFCVVTPEGRARLAAAEDAMSARLEHLLEAVSDRDAFVRGLAELDNAMRTEMQERLKAALLRSAPTRQ